MENVVGTSDDNLTNALQNNSGPLNDFDYNSVNSITQKIEFYSMPFICIFGLVGNTLAAITFLKKSLRKTSCSLYLAARSISDNGFLITLTLIWISSTFDLRLSQVLGSCQIMVFLSYFCGCVSVWLVVFLTTENYIRICHPFIVKRFCTTRYAKTLILLLCLVVLAIYHIPLWISDSNCSPSPSFYEITQAFVYTDSILTLVLPTILMGILIIAITCSMVRSFRRKDRLKQNQGDTTKHRREQKQNSPMARVTKMLFAVSLTFFLMNFPSHVIRLRLMINSFMKGYVNAPAIEAAVQTVALQLYYISLALNIIIYLVFGANFRKEFKATFLNCHPTQCPVFQRKSYVIVRSVQNTSPSIVLGNTVHTQCTMLDADQETVESAKMELAKV